MSGDPLENERHTLIVTGAERDQLYQRFARLYAFSSDVLVMRDRRVGQRRRGAGSPAVERRRGDRRATPPDWIFPPDRG